MEDSALSSRDRLKRLFAAMSPPRSEAEAARLELELDSVIAGIEAEALAQEGFEQFVLDYLADKQNVIADSLVMKSQGLQQEE